MAIVTAKSQAVSNTISRVLRTSIRNTRALYPRLCTRVPSTSETENYSWLGDVPQMKEFLGARQFDQLRAMTYSVTNKVWEQSLGLERHKVDDEKLGLYKPTINKLGTKAVRNPDKLLAELIVNGESNACYDGQNFFSTTHVEGDSGTQSNMRTHTVVSTSAVTVAEFRDSFHEALIRMMEFKTDQGDPWIAPEAVMLGGLICLVPLKLWVVAKRAMNEIVTADGSAGVTNILLQTAQVLPMIRMGSGFGGSDVKWDLVYSGNDIRPYVFQDRSPLITLVKGATDIEEKFYKIMTEARYQMGYGLWQGAVRTTFSV